MDRAAEFLNEYLKIFNRTTGEYLNLVADESRVAVQLEDDVAEQLFGLSIVGATTSNTDNYKLYWKLVDVAGTRTVSIYKDSAKTQLVLQGSVVGDGWIDLIEQGGSALSGKVRVVYVADDVDITNIIYVEQLVGYIKINDLNMGAIANALEYMRKFAFYLLEQLYSNQASDEWLDFLGASFFNVERFANEDDASYYQRIYLRLFHLKVSPLTIRDALEDYGDNVQILEGIDDGAFSEVSFANCYRDFELPLQDVVKAAIAGIEGGLPYFFRVVMSNVDPSNYAKIIALIKDFKAVGIGFEVTIVS